MLADIGPLVSLSVNLVLRIMSIAGCYAFWPRVVYARDPASRALAMAIVLGFLAAGLNTFFSQIAAKTLPRAGLVDPHMMQVAGYYLVRPE
ncbi:hypothetical protein [Loktanella sp. M215]|uniref:hypothetical protein n=1 Tax=Loktanella sp. M215 TaxID=2675431 RepID=UPI001F230E67|nr:hypothetical protein [Loktanella sp. M215]MCF7699938.1 hypothetical protein [Loktanella sp. M215]